MSTYLEKLDWLRKKVADFEDWEDFLTDYIGEYGFDLVVDAIECEWDVDRATIEKEAENVLEVFAQCDREREAERQAFACDL